VRRARPICVILGHRNSSFNQVFDKIELFRSAFRANNLARGVMRGRFIASLVAAALGNPGGVAHAMSPADQSATCRVIDGGKLPANSGGADALCEAVSAAVEAQAPGRGHSVEIRVLGSSRLAASVMSKDGLTIAEQSFASMDKHLTADSFKRFAVAIARELAKSGVAK